MQIQSASSLSSQVARSNTGLQKVFEKLSTGKVLNRASDNPASVSMARELEKQVRAFKQSDSNLGDAMNALKTAEGASSGISDMLQRQRELAIQSKNGTLSDQDRSALNSEFQQISAEIGRQAKSTQFNGQHLTDGSSPLSDGTGQIQSGAGPQDQMKLDRTDLRSAAKTGDISNPIAAADALKSIDEQLRKTTSNRVNLAVKMNAMEAQRSVMDKQNINTSSALSGIEDLDMAQGAMEKARQDALNQSAVKSMQSFGEMSRNNLQALL